MTPEERKSVIRKELARRELERRGGSTDDGVTPVAIEEDQPGWDWARKNFPGTFNTVKEYTTGIAKGVGNLPNIVPNTVNTAKSLHDLHFGKGTGEVAPEDQWQPWMTGTGMNEKSIEEMNPTTPGWENVRRYGEISGSAAPAGLGAMVAAPLLAYSGGRIGNVADILTNNTDTRKWERTGETLVPLITGAGRTARGVVSRAGIEPPKLGVKSVLAAGGLSALSPETALGLAAGLAGMKAATAGSKGVVSDLGRTLATTVAPMATDDPRRRGPR